MTAHTTKTKDCDHGRGDLPRITRFLGVDDCAGASCPHCGATGRYIIRFQVEDGRQLGAMRGCIKLFPVTELARQHQYFVDKQARYARQRPSWELNARDREALRWIMDAIEGRVDARQAIAIATSARSAAAMAARRWR